MSSATYVTHREGQATYRYPEGQRFECRDCAARCCAMPWRVIITPEERARFEAQDWIQERFQKLGVAFEELPSGSSAMPLVVRESDQRLVCAFLDDDELCSQLKHHEREFWSRTCQTFPFEFIEDADGKVRVALSEHCPSIRNNYGEPLSPQLGKYLQANGGTKKLAKEMLIGAGTKLTQLQWMAVVEHWEGALQPAQGAATTGEALWQLFRLTVELGNLLVGQEEVSDGTFNAKLNEAVAKVVATPEATDQRKGQPSTLGRLLIALSLSRLTLPLRLIDKPRLSLRNAWFGYRNTIRLWKRQGEINLLQLPEDFDLARLSEIPPALANDEHENRVRTYFLGVIRRDNLFCEEGRSLHDIVLDLGLAYAVLQFVARCRALAAGRESVAAEDVGEGIAFAECFFLYHYNRTPPPALLKLLMATLSTNEPAFRGILTVEA